ncbi:MAG TPA: SCO family protein [Devosia sp.]|nr:SCO family protein [Devosia sp.]
MTNASANPKKPLGGLALFRIVLWIAVAVVALGAGAMLIVTRTQQNSTLAGLTGAPFTLESTAGGEFTQASFNGTPTLLFFGYTFCPDVCPTTLAELTAARQQLGISPDKLRIVFATVDPARDTLSQLKSYLSNFSGSVIGLTGTQAQVDQAKAAFGIYSQKGQDDGSGNYTVDHTASVFMLGKQGEFEGTLAYGEDPSDMKAKIKRLAGV